MPALDVAYLVCVLFVALLLSSLPGCAGLYGAGPRYRVAVLRQLAVCWGIIAAVVGWTVVGFCALSAGPAWVSRYRQATLFLMGEGLILLPFALRALHRSGAAVRRARLADQQAAGEVAR